jgi:hypothetical protein
MFKQPLAIGCVVAASVLAQLLLYVICLLMCGGMLLSFMCQVLYHHYLAGVPVVRHTPLSPGSCDMTGNAQLPACSSSQGGPWGG